MNIQSEFERTGGWLFRRRGVTPLFLLAMLLLTLTGFNYPAQSHSLDMAWDGFYLLISLAGLSVRIATVGFVPSRTSGRNTETQIADSLNTTGRYSLMRHPLYFGNALIWLGVALFPRMWWCALVMALAFVLLYERIMFAEEKFLRDRFGAEFESWAARPRILALVQKTGQALHRI